MWFGLSLFLLFKRVGLPNAVCACPDCGGRTFHQDSMVASVKTGESAWSLGMSRWYRLVSNTYFFVRAPRVVAIRDLRLGVSLIVRNPLTPRLDLFLIFGAVLTLIGERGFAGDEAGDVGVDVVSRAFLSLGFGLLDAICCPVFVVVYRMDLLSIGGFPFCSNHHSQHASVGSVELLPGLSHGPRSRSADGGGPCLLAGSECS